MSYNCALKLQPLNNSVYSAVHHLVLCDIRWIYRTLYDVTECRVVRETKVVQNVNGLCKIGLALGYNYNPLEDSQTQFADVPHVH
jgi:hypothetical protein